MIESALDINHIRQCKAFDLVNMSCLFEYLSERGRFSGDFLKVLCIIAVFYNITLQNAVVLETLMVAA